jgi:N-glycosylase/DNA lyase
MRVMKKNFNIQQIADSGQCFRMNQMKTPSNKISYEMIAYGKYLELEQVEEDQVEFNCSEEEYYELWEDYFDLSYDYESLVNDLIEGEDTFLKEAAAYGKGIRILKQEPFEAMISFIISQNKNIPAIRSGIEALCTRYGEKIIIDEKGEKEYYAFPTPEALADADKEDLRRLKMGYRDEYIISAAKAVKNGDIDLECLKQVGFDAAVKALKGIHGIGDKVANCISLYGLHHIEGFPVDVWIKRVLDEIYHNEFKKEQYFGYAGIVQQYMFYYMRYLKGRS